MEHLPMIRNAEVYIDPDKLTSRGIVVDSHSEMTDRTVALERKLEKKDLEIEKLCILLESLQPLPGLRADNMRKQLDNNIEDTADFRDSKIVSLAKKNRNITVMLNKERASADSRGIQIQSLLERLELLEGHQPSSSKKTEEQDTSLLRKEVASLNRTIDDLRKKCFHAIEENKKLLRALLNEVGDSVRAEEAIDGTWRGRAQQIIMLKAKVKKLTSATESRNISLPPSSTILATAKLRNTDADTRAQEELVDMSQERKQAVETIIEQRDALSKAAAQLEEKLLAYKARIKNIEMDLSRQRQQIKVLLKVKEGDDELIDALQKEIQRFKRQIKSKMGPVSDSTVAPRAASSPQDASDISQLRSLCKSQAGQIRVQDGMIRSVSSHLV
jgi:predicted  nucleic acid-binding Zn-ribbon protein